MAPLASESALEMEFENGSRIVALPGKEETIRGFSGVALLIVDEAARVPDALYQAVRPMLAVSGGQIILLSTPFGNVDSSFENGRQAEAVGIAHGLRLTTARASRASGWKRKESRSAISGSSRNTCASSKTTFQPSSGTKTSWRRWTTKSCRIGVLEMRWNDDYEDRSPIRSYSGVRVKGAEGGREERKSAPSPSPVTKIRPIVGLDLGQVSDPSALALMDKLTTGNDDPVFHCTYLHRWPTGTPYPKIVEGVAKMLDGASFKGKQRPVLAVDATGVGRPVADMFNATGIAAKFMPIVITGGHQVNIERGNFYVPKRLLVSTVQVALQTKRFKFAGQLPEAATLVSEMQNFQLTFTENANDTYEGRKGAHDDLLLAVAISLWAGQWYQGEPYIEHSYGFRTYW